MRAIEPELIRNIAARGEYLDVMKQYFPFPRVLNVELTNHCNLRCVMCLRDLVRPAGFMDEALFRKVVDEAALYGAKLWLNFAGEPLLHKSFFELARYCREKPLQSVNINTNATLLTEDVGKELLDCGLEAVALSFDSTEKETYETIRVNADFESTLENVLRFIRLRDQSGSRVKIFIFAVRQERNEHERDALRQFWRSRVSKEDRVVFLRFNTLGGQLGRPSGSTGTRKGERLPCLQLWRNIVVLWNGDAVMCCGDFRGTHVMGNVSERTLREIWFGDDYRRLRMAHLEDDYRDFEFCGNCGEWRFEGGHGRYERL